jgi:hypothetical protein
VHKREEYVASDRTASTRGVIQEIINKFQFSLPWLNRRNYYYYTWQLKGAPRSITTNIDKGSQLSGITSTESSDRSRTIDKEMDSERQPISDHETMQTEPTGGTRIV